MNKPTKPNRIAAVGLVAGLLALGLVPALGAADGTTPPVNTDQNRRSDGKLNDQSQRPGVIRDGATGNTGTEMRDLARADRRFFTKAAGLGEKEVALSRIAGDRATNPGVRGFADRMVREHNAANSELASLASKKGVSLEREDASEQRREANKWNEKSGDDFDKDYLEAMIESHEDMVDILEKAEDSDDREIAAFAARMLPQIKAHLKQAEMLKDSID